MFRRFLRVMALLLAGFAGGTLSPWVLGWVRGNVLPGPADAVAIANTYIVFTTIIFVGVTVILAVAGYVFTQHFSASKSSQENQLMEEIREKVREDEKVGIALAESMLENSDVKRHLHTLLTDKLNEMLRSKIEDAEAVAEDLQATADQFRSEAKGIAGLAAQLNGNGKGGKT